MADLKQIQFKRSKVSGKRPLPADIAEGELALNIADATMFTKNAAGEIIDLGFAKGGKIDGDVVHTGKYTQTGDYVQTGNTTIAGDLNVRNINTSVGINAAGEIATKSGSVRVVARADQNTHLWFQGEEVVGEARNGERAVLYATPQTADAGFVNLRVRPNKDAKGSDAAGMFNFSGGGDFMASRNIVAKNEVEGLVGVLNFVDHYKKPYTQYDSSSLATWANTTQAYNSLYKSRAYSGATIWHQLNDSRTGDEFSFWTGSTPTVKTFAIRGDGFARTKKGLMVGGADTLYSTLGEESITIGDNDTGFKWLRDGQLGFMGNGAMVAHSVPSALYSDKTLVAQYTTGASDTPIMPGEQIQLIRVATNVDGNAAGGGGDTHIGLSAGGKMYHYFRGKGYTSIDTAEGLKVTSGPTDLTGTVNISGQTNANGRILANAGIAMFNDTTMEWSRNTDFARISFKNTGDADSDSYMKFVTGDNGNEHFKFFSIGGSTETLWATINAGQVIPANYGNFDTRFQMNTAQGTVEDNPGVAWNAKTGFYNANTGGASMMIDHRYQAAGSCPAYQLRVNYRNGGIWYRSARDAYGFEAGWDRFFTEQNPPTPLQIGAANFGLNSLNVNLNNFWERSRAGLYFQEGNAGATAANNYPVQEAGALSMLPAAYVGCIQEYTTFNSGRKFTRGINGPATGSGPWAPWKEYFLNGVTPGLGVATSNTWGGASIAIGDNDTGFRQEGDGQLTAWANNQRIQRWTSANTIAYKQVMTDGVDGPALRMNAIGASSSSYLLCTRAGVNGWYIGFGSSDTTATWHNYLTNTNIQLRASDVYTNKKLSVTGDVVASAWVYGTEFYLNSDARYKENIVDLESVRGKLHSVPVHRYSMKDGSNDNAIGVIAQEVEDVFPELVTTKEDGYKSVNYRALSTVLWKIVQEQDNELEDVKARLARIEELLSK